MTSKSKHKPTFEFVRADCTIDQEALMKEVRHGISKNIYRTHKKTYEEVPAVERLMIISQIRNRINRRRTYDHCLQMEVY